MEKPVIVKGLFPIYALYVTNSAESIFCGMVTDREEAETKIKDPEKLLSKAGKSLEGSLKAYIKECVP